MQHTVKNKPVHNIVIMSMWCIYEKYMLLYGVYIVDISGK